MKALIISIKAGYGHHSTAKAIIEYMTKQNVECEMLDTFEYINPKLNDSVSKGYLMTTKYTPEAFGKIYSSLDKKDQKYDKYSIISILSNIVSYQLKDFISEYQPDIIIGTHSFACMIITYLKEKGHISCPTIGIVTDFTVHPFWESTELDYYVTADELLNYQLEKKGISKEKALPFGIPVGESFSIKNPKDDALKQLGLENKQTILIMMGSMGFGNLEKSLTHLDRMQEDFQILCVCGNNERIKKEIDKHTWKKSILTFGFVNNVTTMMDASDLIITKPGGLTMSETLAKKLPSIIINPIPGQEDRNLEFLVNYGASIMATDTFPIDEALHSLLSHSWRLNLMQKSVEKLSKPNSTKNLCEFIIKDIWNK